MSALLHKKVVMSVTNDLVTDQRVHRSCMALCDAGYLPTLVGRRLPMSPPLSRQYPTVRMRLLFRKSALFYAEYNLRLFLRLLFAKADLFYANDTDTLLANYLAARLRRKPLFFDAHEMFPEVPELVDRPAVKRFWTAIEDWILPRMARRHDMAAVTVCRSIADIYLERYGLKMGVVRNVPMHVEADQQAAQPFLLRLPPNKHLLLYQGAVNVGRGIDWLMDAMPLLDHCHLVVAGVGDEYQRLSSLALQEPYLGRVTFLGRVEPPALKCLTAKASLGLVLLENRGLNYYYSLPNRIGDFVEAGVPLLATDFPEIRSVVKKYNIGTLLDTSHSDAIRLAHTIRTTLLQWQQLASSEKASRFNKARADLSWDNEKKSLLNAINTISNV